jgi:signal transduction histidine kinase
MRNLSIKSKLYFMILIIFIPMIIHQVFQIYSSFEKSIELELKSNEDFAEAVSVSFTNYLERLWDTELSMGLAILNNIEASNDETGNYMRIVSENQPTIKEYSWIDLSTMKMTASSVPEAVGVSVFGREYINRIMNGSDKTVSDLVISRVDNEPTFVVARGIRKDNMLKGIITATIKIEGLDMVLPSSRATGYSFFGLLDSQGVFVFRNGIPDVAARMISAKENPNVKSALKGRIVKVRKYSSPVTGEDMTGVDLPVHKVGWVAYANTSYDEVLLRTFRDIRSELIALLFTVALGLLVTIIVAKQILNPITILQSTALEMSNGNLNIRTNIEGTDEIALAAQAFDQMAASIEEYDALKTQFFSNLSHELKTPLNIILSSIHMVESNNNLTVGGDTSKSFSKYMPMMRQNCYRLLRLINNLIDITRIDSGFFKFNFGNYNIVSVVEDITLSVANYSESKGIDIIFDTEVEEKIIGCDPDKIERIMLNLLSNSIKFTPSGGSIFVNILNQENKVSLVVRDTGIGIPSDKISIIFERFRQVDSSLQREYEGSGIGLSLVKALAEAHKGNIYVKSELGEGTEVTVELPAMLSSEENLCIRDTFYSHNMDKIQRINIEFSDIYN